MESTVGIDNKIEDVPKVGTEKVEPKPYTGKKRGRKPKSEQEKLESAQKRKLERQQKSLKDGTATQNELINRQALAHLYHRREFVCDRCNSLRRACFGTLSSCNNCLIANKECTLKRPRIRKSKPRKLKAVNMDVSLDQSVDLSQMVPLKSPDNIENKRLKELEDKVLELTDELKVINQEKKLSEEHYRELETENDYLKETISTLQLLFKEQQNLVQLLEKQQIQNLRKLKMLQEAKHEQLQQTSINDNINALDSNVFNKALAQHNSLQFQLQSHDRKEWLAHLNNTSTLNSPPNGSTLPHHSNVVYSDYEQVQAQLNNITKNKILEENEVSSVAEQSEVNLQNAPEFKTPLNANKAVKANSATNRRSSQIHDFHKKMYETSNTRSNSKENPEKQSKLTNNNDMDLYMVM
ncbi:hypothetical protein ACO0OE_001676 [Hanseniaspora uvarum]